MLNLNYEPEIVVDTLNMPNEEWLKYRSTGLGGSDVSVLFGVNPWTTRRSLYFNKIGMEKAAPMNQFTLDFGHTVEPFVASWFQYGYDHNPGKYKTWVEIQLGKKIKGFVIYKDTFMYRHPLFPFLQSNLDYRFRAETVDGEFLDGIFECKTTNYNTFRDHWGWNKVPEYYAWQCRQYMATMNVNYTIIACVCGNNESDYAMGFVKRDLEKEEELLYTAKDFWENNVLARVEPLFAEDEEHAHQELQAMWDYRLVKVEDDGSPTVSLGTDTLSKVRKYQDLSTELSAYNKRVKQLEAAKDLMEAEIYSDMKQHHKCSVFDPASNESIQIFPKPSSRTGIDRDRLKRERPDIEKAYATKTESVHIKIISTVNDVSKSA